MENKKEISEQTVRTYKFAMTRLFKLNLTKNENDEYDIDEFVNVCKQKNIPLASQKTMLVALLYNVKNKSSEKYLSEIKKKISAIKSEMCQINKGKKISREQNSIISFNDVIKIYKTIKREFINTLSTKTLTNLLVVAFYTLIPPRGINDYRLLKFGNEKTKINDKFNYYIKMNDGNKHYFLFNNFKTKKTYGPIKIKIFNDELIKIINMYITLMEMNENDLFFPNIEMNLNNFVEKLNRIIERYINIKHISIDIIRDSFIGYLRKTGQLEKRIDRINMSYLMGHKITNIEKYYQITKNISSENINEQKYLFYTPDNEQEVHIFLPSQGSDKIIHLPCDKLSLNALSIVANNMRKRENSSNQMRNNENICERKNNPKNLIDILKKILGS